MLAPIRQRNLETFLEIANALDIEAHADQEGNVNVSNSTLSADYVHFIVERWLDDLERKRNEFIDDHQELVDYVRGMLDRDTSFVQKDIFFKRGSYFAKNHELDNASNLDIQELDMVCNNLNTYSLISNDLPNGSVTFFTKYVSACRLFATDRGLALRKDDVFIKKEDIDKFPVCITFRIDSDGFTSKVERMDSMTENIIRSSVPIFEASQFNEETDYLIDYVAC